MRSTLISYALLSLACNLGCTRPPQETLRTPNATRKTSSPSCVQLATSIPELSAAVEPSIPTSRFSILSELSEEYINRRLDRELGRTLAREKNRKVGAPGRATYTVKRGRARLAQDKHNVSLQIPISADISVCKPFGHSCFRYGSCKPRFTVEAAFERRLESDYQWKAPRLGSTTEVGCRIAVDVTPQLESVMEGELKKVRRQIRDQWPDFALLAKKLGVYQTAPIQLWKESCAQASELKVQHLALSVKEVVGAGEKSRSLTSGFQFRSRLLPLETCDAVGPQAPPTLPELTRARSIPAKSKIYLPESVNRNDLKEALQAALAASPGPGRLDQLKVGRNRIYYSLHFEGEFCGEVWLSAELFVEEEQLVLKNQKWEGSYPPAFEKKLLDHEGRVKGAFVLPLQGARWLKEGKEKDLIERLFTAVSAELKKESLHLKLGAVKHGAPKLSYFEEGVVVFYPLAAPIALKEASK